MAEDEKREHQEFETDGELDTTKIERDTLQEQVRRIDRHYKGDQEDTKK